MCKGLIILLFNLADRSTRTGRIKSSRVDIEFFEDRDDPFGTDPPGYSPGDDIEIFPVADQAIQYAFKEQIIRLDKFEDI